MIILYHQAKKKSTNQVQKVIAFMLLCFLLDKENVLCYNLSSFIYSVRFNAMWLAIVISAVTCLAMIMAVLFFPKIKVFNISLDSYWVVTAVGAVLLCQFVYLA